MKVFTNHKRGVLTFPSVMPWNGTNCFIVTPVYQLKYVDNGRIYFKTDCIDTWEEEVRVQEA